MSLVPIKLANEREENEHESMDNEKLFNEWMNE